MKKWFMYVLECRDGSLYTGITTDVERRLKEHNQTRRGSKYTRSRRPVKLLGWIDFKNRSEATRAECFFKRLSRSQKLEKIASFES